MQRRTLLALAVAAGLAAVSGAATAQSWPTGPVRLVVPYPAGGLADVIGRGFANRLQAEWHQPVIVDNRPGANTIIGAENVSHAPPDGMTLLMATEVTMSANQYLYNRLPYNPERDLVPVVGFAQSIQVMVASPKFAPNNVQELIAFGKAHPGEPFYGSWGLGSSGHLDTLAFASMAGITPTHVPFKGIADVLPAVMAGDVQISLSGVSPALELIRSGRVKALGFAGPTRSPVMPDVPTFAEQGLPDFKSRSWFGFVAPAKTPKPVIDKIAADVTRVAADPDFIAKYITGVGLMSWSQGPAEFGKVIASDAADFKGRIEKANIKLD